MFERFTERARQVVVFAQEEARAFKHNYIGTEHLLLGVLREQEGVGARVLVSLGVSLDSVRDQVARMIGQGDELETGQIPFTPRAKKVLELALREALSLGHNLVGTEHLLLGLAREGEGIACRILLDFGATADAVRDAVIRQLSGVTGRVLLPDDPQVQRPRRPRRMPRRVYDRSPRLSASATLVVGWLLFAGALGVGILIGWAIWG